MLLKIDPKGEYSPMKTEKDLSAKYDLNHAKNKTNTMFKSR